MDKRGVLALTIAACVTACADPSPPAERSAAPANEPAPPTGPAPEQATGVSLAEGWNTFEPGGDTACSDGSDYRFFVRPGDPDKLLVYFQGGGACWTPENCDPHLDPTYKTTVEPTEYERFRGIFDFDNPENPFANYSVVMAPYCTGDVHLGTSVASYQAPAREARVVEGEEKPPHDAHELQIHHKGLVNARAVLEWTYEQFPAPAEVFVTGSSAGAIPSPYFAWKIADHYTDARIAQLGDGAGGYRRSSDTNADRMTRWGAMENLTRYPEFEGVTEDQLAYEDLYIAAAKRHPDVLFAEYDAAEDSVQKRFLALSGNDTDTLLELLEANHADIRAEVSNFRVYVAGGDSHTILARPEFYTFQVNGVRIRDWVAELAAFRTVDDVRCNDCAEAELYQPTATAAGEPGGT